jgi:hypothetical protein
MRRKRVLLLWRKAAWGGVLLPLALFGCGGSHSASTPTVDSSAVISWARVEINPNPGYSITLEPSGSATYTNYASTPPNLTGLGTVPAALTTQFFQDLSAAGPLQDLPGSGPASTGTVVLQVVKYQGQSTTLGNLNDPREEALSSDAAAIAVALGLRTS